MPLRRHADWTLEAKCQGKQDELFPDGADQKNTPKTSSGPGLAVPDEVSIAMGEIAEDMREGLLALAVGAGLQVMAALMEADVAAVCGPRGKHDPGRTAVRHGRERGSVTLGGRRVGVQRPRTRATDGGEVPVPAL